MLGGLGPQRLLVRPSRSVDFMHRASRLYLRILPKVSAAERIRARRQRELEETQS